MARLRVRRLRLQGVSRPYEVSFLDPGTGQPAALAIISGQISTGKTSVLEFIRYCLGGADFPHHPEIRSRVRSALLECDLQGTTFVIERSAVLQPSKFATVHSCSLDLLDEPHFENELVIAPPSDENSLSQYLLNQFGIGEVVLREAPTQDSSAVDRLSIRDLLRIMFVENPDLDNRNLLLENNVHVVRLKHEQVLDLLFGAHDNTAASFAARARSLGSEIKEREVELATIEGFMKEQRVPERETIDGRIAQMEEVAAGLQSRRDQIEAQMDAEAAFGDQQRTAYHAAADRARRASNELRESQTQLDRLIALGAQYEQDVKKLVFAKEASRLFDPFAIQVCPWCLQPMDPPVETDLASCFACHQPLGDDDEVDLDRELRAVKTRQRELLSYVEDLRDRASSLEVDLQSASEEQRAAQQSFDEAMRARFSPYMSQRDDLLAEQSRIDAESREQRRLLGMHGSRQRRREELGALRQQLAELLRAQVDAEATNVERSDVIDDLKRRFGEILAEFHFPKLANAELDQRYVPSVRGVRYDQLGSAGAMTLISLAWYLSVFEKSVEDDGAHPGLLMIDSPQKNLVPASGQQADDYQAPAIARGVYEHLLRWSSTSAGSTSQILIVDNDPPGSANAHIAVRYSGDVASPPYGLIDDAID
ncbi:MAG: hypothetical protein AB7T32_06990 [Dehalococcoidia bacterium]